MKKIPIWRGSKELAEQPTSPDWEFEAQKTSCTRIFEGPYETCLARRPKVGQTMSGFADLYVDKVKINRMPGRKGRMVVTLNNDIGDIEIPENPQEYQPVYEVENVVFERPIEQNPFFAELTPADMANVKAWEAEPDPTLRAAYKFTHPTTNTQVTLLDLAKKLAEKKLRGQETYIMFAPVARLTRQANSLSSMSAPGTPGSPAFTGPPSGFDYLVTAGRGTRTGKNGKWELFTEWTGAHEWDPDLYP